MDEHPDEIAASAVVTLVRRAGEPLSSDMRRRVRSNIEGHLAGDLIVDTFDDDNAEDPLLPASAPARRSRWLLACAAAVVAIVGVGTIVTVNDRGATPPATSPTTPPPSTPDVAPEPVVVSTASPTGELAVARRMDVPDQPGDVVLSEFLPDGRLLQWSTTDDGEIVTLYNRWAVVDTATELPKGTAVAGAGERVMRDVAIGPDDVLYASYITSATGSWDFDLVAYSFEQQPRELGRWPADWACSGDCGKIVLDDEGVVIDDAGGIVPYVDPGSGAASGKQQHYVLGDVRASSDPFRESGVSGIYAMFSYGDERWTVRIEGTHFLTPILVPQRDGSLLGTVYDNSPRAVDPILVLWLRPGGPAELYRIAETVILREMYGVLGGTSILAIGRDLDGDGYELLRLTRG